MQRIFSRHTKGAHVAALAIAFLSKCIDEVTYDHIRYIEIWYIFFSDIYK